MHHDNLLAKLFDNDMEESICSTMALHNETINRILTVLSPDDFASPRNRHIFNAIVDTYMAHSKTDLLLIKDEITRRGLINNVGGASKLSEILCDAPIALDAMKYAKVIKEKAFTRKIIMSAQKLIEDCSANYKDTGMLIDSFISSTLSKDDEVMDLKIGDLFENVINESELSTEYINTGFTFLDYFLGNLYSNNLIFIGARPSIGKTSLATQIAAHLSLRGFPTLFFSLEMTGHQLAQKILSQGAGVPVDSLRHDKQGDNKDKIAKTLERLKSMPLHIYEKCSLSALDIARIMSYYVIAHKIRVVFIDYLQLIRLEKSSLRHDLQIGMVTKTLKEVSKRLEVPIFILTQLNRNIEQRYVKKPLLSDIRDSGSIEQDADVVMFLNREISDPHGEIIIAKNRMGRTGQTGINFDHQTTYYYE
jgi:replicative DNA helicase